MFITAHTIIKNEEQWIWYAINSVIDFVDKIIIFDTGSTDQTVNIIKSIKNPKIFFEEKGPVSPKKLVELRNEQIRNTKTEWFMLLDGDEVWPKKSISKLIKVAPGNKIAVVVRTRNCVGDIFHHLPENRGEYKLLGMKGHLNIRVYKKSPEYKWEGIYPLESYSNRSGSINNQDDKLFFLDTYYWHLTHLKRSSVRKRQKLEIGIKAKSDEIPEIFYAKRPDFIPYPFTSYNILEKLLSWVVTPLKNLKNL